MDSLLFGKKIAEVGCSILNYSSVDRPNRIRETVSMCLIALEGRFYEGAIYETNKVMILDKFEP